MDDLRHRLGRRIKELRTRGGLTQEALGERSGVSYKFIGEVERGVGNPTVDTLAGIATALDVDVAALFASGSRASAYPPLTADELAAVRDARESLDQLWGRLSRRRAKRR